MSLDPNTALKSMADVLHNERVVVLDRVCGSERDRDAAALMWAAACAQEAVTIWRSLHPAMEREMLAEMIKAAK